MRQTLMVVTALCSWPVLPVLGQHTLPPVRLGAHVAGNMMNGPFDMYRVGGQLVIPVSARLALSPSVSRFLDGAEWEVSAALRVRPFGSSEESSPLYLGVGAAAINFGPNSTGYDLWMTGLELPKGRLRPYVELQFLGLVHRLITSAADFGVQAHAGLTWAVR